MSFAKDLRRGIFNGYIDDEIQAIEAFKPKLIVNDIDRGEKVLTSIDDELKKCDEFWFSVAFVTTGGVTTLLNTLKELEKKNVKGVIIASQYQNFSQPNALRKLLKFENIELRIVPDDRYHMHAKAYIFRKGDEYSIIVGSSNLTNDALCVNQEWNIKVSSTSEGSIIKQSLLEFASVQKSSVIVDENWLEAYERLYEFERNIRSSVQNYELKNALVLNRINPNQMQIEALSELQRTRDEGEVKALIVSATGTGKTFLSAFDVRNFNPKRFLFVVHRELIASEAMKSFKRVLGPEFTMAVLSGKNKDTSHDYLFSTIQTLSKDEVLYSFDKAEFDYIVFDEVHRAGAQSYQKVLNHFTPKFLLGMSATPERSDGYDIYQLFDHNLAYEIRLNQAMKENMVCPFHYFGISDITVNGEQIEDSTEFRYLEADERVDNIINKATFYGHSGNRVKGLVFCSRNDEAKALSDQFNKRGYDTIALSGSDSNDKREAAIKKLEQKELDGKLDYIFTVDIFNEGVDIPSINQVIMIRPTQSAIIFVQQLGRGLRHDMEKEYVVVLDFIGNYNNNFFIPIALSGDRSYNKDNLRRYVIEGNRIIPGESTVNFDEISKKKIFSAIDAANFDDIRSIKESYFSLKNMLGRIPSLLDFEKYGSIDPVRILVNPRIGSYHTFLTKYDDEYVTEFDEISEEVIEFISKKMASGKRPQELLLFQLLLNGEKEELFSKLEKELLHKYDINLNKNAKDSLLNIFTNNFNTGAARNTYKNCLFIESEVTGKDIKISNDFAIMLNNEALKTQIFEIIEFGLKRYESQFGKRYNNTDFQLYQKYTYEDVCRLLNWDKGEVPLNIGGYKFDKKTKSFPVFINYHKHEDINATIAYEDRFVSPKEIIAISKSGRTRDSEDIKTIYSAKSLGVEMHLFVRKNKDDKISKEFYYLGHIEAHGEPHEFVMKGTEKNAVEIRYRLDVPVRRDLFDYFHA
jgi:superfamily II DNA or RNA helicase